MAKKPIIAIMYDFDKTLSTTDMQNYAFIPKLGMKPDEFWNATGEFTKATGVERILSYMYMMITLSKEKGIDLTREYLNEMGKDIKFFPGVETWFKRINKYGREKGVKIEHYLISSGTKEIVEGCSIAKEFTEMYGCEFYYDPITKLPIWPKLAINYTQKTQYLFRISKGTIDQGDDKSINEKYSFKRIPYENMIYLGDGMTDIPCMALLLKEGGSPIAIFEKKNSENIKALLKGGRVKYACKANYKEGSQLDKTIKLIIDRVSVVSSLQAKTEALKKHALKFANEDEE